MNKVVEHKTMYRDMIRILKESGLADLIDSKDFTSPSFRLETRSTYLKKGRFYFASGGGNPLGYIFYVNPVDWYQKDMVGLVYLSLDGVKEMLEDPSLDPMTINWKGWNNAYSDIDALEDYHGTDALKEFKLQNKELGDFDFFRNDGFKFYELPDFRPQFGVFNWWW